MPSNQLEWHGHNDFHKGLVNGVAAWMYGCSAVNGALLGFGERTGNTPVEAMLIDYISLTGNGDGIDTAAISEMAEYFRRELGFPIPSNYPFVGSEFNSTSAGIHADGMMKNEEIYNIFDTTKILKRPMGVIITDKSGIAGIAHWVNSHLGLDADKKIDKRHPGLAKMNKWVLEQYEQGRTTSISHEELQEKAKKFLSEYFESDLDKLKKKAQEISLHLVEEMVERKEMRTMDHAKQEGVIQKLLDQNAFIQFAYVVNAEGKKTTRNITQIQYKAQFEHSGLGDNFSDRPWFIKPMKDGKSFVSDFYTSKITGALCITVSAPISDDRERDHRRVRRGHQVRGSRKGGIEVEHSKQGMRIERGCSASVSASFFYWVFRVLCGSLLSVSNSAHVTILFFSAPQLTASPPMNSFEGRLRHDCRY